MPALFTAIAMAVSFASPVSLLADDKKPSSPKKEPTVKKKSLVLKSSGEAPDAAFGNVGDDNLGVHLEWLGVDPPKGNDFAGFNIWGLHLPGDKALLKGGFENFLKTLDGKTIKNPKYTKLGGVEFRCGTKKGKKAQEFEPKVEKITFKRAGKKHFRVRIVFADSAKLRKLFGNASVVWEGKVKIGNN